MMVGGRDWVLFLHRKVGYKGTDKIGLRKEKYHHVDPVK